MVQVVFIHGGMTFRNREDYLEYLKNREVSLEKKEKWYKGDYLERSLDVVRLDMPCEKNAKYEEWKITFEKYVPLLDEELVFIGMSLGGVFLAKYLSENDFSKHIVSAYLVGVPYDDDLVGEDLVGFEIGSLELLEENCDKVCFMFSKDDDVVPVRHAEKFKEKVDAEIIVYESKEGHFQAKEFPEIVEKVKEDIVTAN